MQIITPEDLVLFVYNETPPRKEKAIKDALAGDLALQDDFNQIISIKEQLQEVGHSPREESINKIFAYAGKTVSHLHSH